MKTISILFLLVLSLPCFGREWYVSLNGSDSNSGTIDFPLRSVQKGITSAFPGDAIYIREGIYNERIISATLRQGTVSARILLTSYPGENAVIKGLLWLRRPSYWDINRLKVNWDNVTGRPGEHMVKITSGIGWTIKNCEFSGAKSYACLYITANSSWPGEPNNWIVSHNAIHDTYKTNSTNQDHLIYCNPGITPTNGIIERNLLWNAVNGDGVKLGGSSSTSGGCNGVQVKYNTIYNTSMNVRAVWKASNNVIEYNILQRTKPGTAPFQYGNIRGYQISTDNSNVAKNNFCFESKMAIDNYDGGKGVMDGGGNLWPVNPQFDSIGVNGFHPQNTQAQAYGRYGL